MALGAKSKAMVEAIDVVRGRRVAVLPQNCATPSRALAIRPSGRGILAGNDGSRDVHGNPVEISDDSLERWPFGSAPSHSNECRRSGPFLLARREHQRHCDRRFTRHRSRAAFDGPFDGVREH